MSLSLLSPVTSPVDGLRQVPGFAALSLLSPLSPLTSIGVLESKVGQDLIETGGDTGAAGDTGDSAGVFGDLTRQAEIVPEKRFSALTVAPYGAARASRRAELISAHGFTASQAGVSASGCPFICLNDAGSVGETSLFTANLGRDFQLATPAVYSEGVKS